MQNKTTNKIQIEASCNNGYKLDFGNVFESALGNYKKIAVYGGLMLLISSVVILILLSIGATAYVGVDNLKEFGDKMIQYSALPVKPLNFQIQSALISLLFSSFLSPFFSGFLKMADSGEKDEEFHIATMFSYYKTPYFIAISLSVLILGLLNNIIFIALDTVGLGILGTIISIVISILTSLTIPLIVFGNLNAFDSIKYSILLVIKQPIIIFGLLVVSYIAAILGLFGFCLGIFFTMPFVFSMQYILYKSIIGIDEISEIDEISGVKN